jgi:hypothetical protein
VQVDLDLAFESSLFEFVHVSVQGNELSSQDIFAWFDVARQLELEAITVVGSKFVGPSVYNRRQCYANRWRVLLFLPAEGMKPDSKILKNLSSLAVVFGPGLGAK